MRVFYIWQLKDNTSAIVNALCDILKEALVPLPPFQDLLGIIVGVADNISIYIPMSPYWFRGTAAVAAIIVIFHRGDRSVYFDFSRMSL